MSFVAINKSWTKILQLYGWHSGCQLGCVSAIHLSVVSHSLIGGPVYSNAILSLWELINLWIKCSLTSKMCISLNGRISLRSAQAANHIAPGSLGPRDAHNDRVSSNHGIFQTTIQLNS